MRDDLERKLAEDYPFMRRKCTLSEQKAQGYIHDLYGAFGCACGDGWYNLLNNLCAEIAGVYKQVGLPADIVVDQVKEKYGALRFYYHFQGQTPEIQAIDSLGHGSFRIKQNNTAIHSRVHAIVDKWEIQSETVCEACGQPGVTRTDLSWFLTLCDTCYLKRKK